MRMFEYVCGNCGHTYRAPQMASSYGKLAFWDESGAYLAVIDAIGDPLFERVAMAVSLHAASASLTDRRRGQVVQRVVAHVSDPAPSGKSYDPEAQPACPLCDFSAPRDWQSVEPPEITELDLPSLSRTAWDGYSAAGQEQLLAQEVNDALLRS
jgi:hypothetical protein